MSKSALTGSVSGLETFWFAGFKGENSMRRRLALVAVFLLLISFCSRGAQAQRTAKAADKPAPETVYVKAGRLFDSTGNAVQENMVIVVEGERIKSISPAAEAKIPANARV
ncbi:MAG: hypothetical protein ACREIB_06160, partial [Pseudomonadota bacterium]